MKQIELENGFMIELDDNVIDNMELVDTLAEADVENPLVVSKVVKMILGEEKRKGLYDSLRTKDGRVPVEAVSNAVQKIFEAFGDKGKNS